MSSVTVEKYVYAQKGALNGLNQSILETLIKVHAQAVALCPVAQDSGGQLKNSLMIVTEKGEQGFNTSGDEAAPSTHKLTVKSPVNGGYVGTNSDHWYPEFGTRFQVAQPFLRPAGEGVKNGNMSPAVAKYCKIEMQKEFLKRKMERRIMEINK